MNLYATLAVLLVAALHAYFLVLEMFLWDKPAGMRAFGQSKERATATKVLAANQGLYNGFLSAGLVFGLLREEPGEATVLFFLACVVIAGLFGAATASRKILFFQAVPAGVAIALVLAS